MRSFERKKLLPYIILLFFLLISVHQAKLIYDQQFIRFDRVARYISTSAYAKVLGLDDLTEKSILDKYGSATSEAQYMDPKNGYRTLILNQYPGFDVWYVYTDWYAGKPYNALNLLVIKDDSLRFGWLKIGIGSTREEVHRAYAKEPAINAKELAYSAEDYPDVDEGFYGDGWSRILFCYDETGIVESMAYQPPAF